MTIPNLSEITTLLLDMDGTLLDLNFDNYFWNQYLHQRYAEIHRVEYVTASRYVSDKLAGQRGSLNWYCTDYWSEEFGVDILALKREVTHLVQYRAGARRFLQDIALSSLQVILVTNAHPDVIELKHTCTGLLDLIPDTVSSHSYGQPKESSRFWQQLAADRTFDAETTLMVDDSISVLKASRDAGIAYQLTIGNPDSSRATESTGEFPVINDLSTLTARIAS